jgi:hypothetical protein
MFLDAVEAFEAWLENAPMPTVMLEVLGCRSRLGRAQGLRACRGQSSRPKRAFGSADRPGPPTEDPRRRRRHGSDRTFTATIVWAWPDSRPTAVRELSWLSWGIFRGLR